MTRTAGKAFGCRVGRPGRICANPTTLALEVHIPVRVSVDDRPLDLRAAAACDPARAGAKAAALAQAAAAGLPVLDGFVLPTGWAGPDEAVRAAWAALSGDGAHHLVVRSSSTVEDVVASSMAGRFVSVVDVRGWEAFCEAVEIVRGSAALVPGEAQMAVLVQPALDASRGGVLFGVDPITGRDDRIVVECSAGTPQQIVSGRVTASRYVLTRRGRVREVDERGTVLTSHDRRRLARLARDATLVFDGPQDIEWAIDRRDRIWLLQSRPITAIGEAGSAEGPILGPGPIGETFPDPLRRLERDLFLAPLRIGMIEALRAIGVVPHARIARSPVVTTVGGRVAADLELLGWVHPPRGWGVLNPIPPARRLIAAWHVGRLRRSLPGLAGDVVAGVDGRLRAVPPLGGLSNEELLAVIRRTREELVRVHAYQILAGMLLGSREDRPGASALGLTALAAGRTAGASDEAIAAANPVVLALTPPRVGPPRPLPAATPSVRAALPELGSLESREALRLRARWLDELAARAAWTLGRRLAAVGVLASPDDVIHLTIHELADYVVGTGHASIGDRVEEAGPPLPATFRCTAAGTVVPVVPPRSRRGVTPPEGRGAGGGRGAGPVRHEGGDVEPGDVLVVRFLSPSLAGDLPGLAGLVSETGSELSHLAILAREYGVPTVVGAHDATGRLPEGAIVVVDGTTGDVELADRTLEEAS